MHISSQLATAGSNQVSSAAISSAGASVSTFHEAFRNAATRSETAGKAGVDGGASSDKSTTRDDAKMAGGTDAGSSATVASGQSGATSLPAADLKPTGQALVTTPYDFSGKTELLAEVDETSGDAAQGNVTQTPAGRTGESKSKKTSPAADSTGAATASADAPASTPDVSLLAAADLLPPPSAPVNEASASSDLLGSSADSSVLASDSGNPVLSNAANQQTAGVDVSADGQSPAVTAPVAPAAILPATASGDLVADAGRLAGATPPKVPNARSGAIPTSDAKPATGTEASSKASVSSASNGMEAVPTPLANLGNVQSATTQQVAPPLVSTSAAGADRSIAGEVRGKRKESTAEGSAPERDSTTTAPAPLAARLAEAQPPAQAGANGADVTALPKALDGSQSQTSSILPVPAQTNLPPAPAPSTAAAASSVPAGSTDPSADPAALAGASSAQLIQSAGQTEMRLGMHSAEFGNISISTSVSRQAISAQISLDHSELGRALAVHLPAIEAKLGSAYGLQARVEVRDESAASRSAADSGQQGGASQEQTGGARGGQGRSGFAPSPVREGTAVSVGSTNLGAGSPSSVAPAERSRLDIRI